MLLSGNFLGWLLLIYPTETLRPGWLNVKRALLQVLPMNRTYLSEFINTTYGCTFYQFVTRYRIEEAKRIMRESSELKMADVAARSGFISPSAFTKIFTKEMGQTPSEWQKNFSSK